MRKLLLASVAALGASVGVAQAQVVTLPTLMPSTTPAPAPGTITVRLGAKLNFYAGVLSDSGDKAVAPTGGAGATGPATGTYKQANYEFGDYVRLYPSLDGVAANGLKYGVFAEIRHESGVGAGGGALGSISGSDTRNGLLYFRREYGYVGTNQLGTVRFGATDPTSGLFETGTFENFNDGGWNGDIEDFFSSSAAPSWPFMVVGAYYTTTKVVYLSPQFYGVDFGFSYEPSTSNVTPLDGCSYAETIPPSVTPAGATTPLNVSSIGSFGASCARLSSSSRAADLARRRNTIDTAVRYRGTFGPVGIAATGGFIGSQHVNYDGAPPIPVRYNGLEIGDFGTAVTIAGLTVGGHISFGRGNGANAALEPVGAVPEFIWLAGASYTIGPVIVGASFFQTNVAGSSGPTSAGFASSVGQLRERGVAAGGTFTVAPGVSLFLDYLYGDRKENGVNLLGDSESSATHNQTRAQLIGLGTQIRW